MMRTKLKKIVLRVFNWIFSSNVELGDIDSVRLLVKEELRIKEPDIESIKLVVREGLRIKESNIEPIKLAMHGLDPGSVDCLKVLCGESAVATKLNTEFLELLEKIALLNRMDDLGDMSEGFQLCYSQEGESLILDRFFDFRPEGFYVDVGAHHPKRFSNTYSFYKRGWRGINIDPTPGVKEMFDEIRPEDIFLSIAVSNTEGEQDFHLFSEPALNTFSKSLADEYQRDGFKLIEVRPIESKTLSSLLEKCPIDKPIDFMSIDVENHELQVLQSNDWNKFRPRVLLVEILNFDMNHSDAYPVHKFILDKDYALFAKTYNTLFYKDTR